MMEKVVRVPRRNKGGQKILVQARLFFMASFITSRAFKARSFLRKTGLFKIFSSQRFIKFLGRFPNSVVMIQYDFGSGRMSQAHQKE
jgi:hypothetical protein